LLGIDFVNCEYNFGVLGDASNKSIRKKGGKGKTYSFAYSDEEQLEQELKRKRGEKIII